MPTGVEVLSSIEKTLNQLRRGVQEVDQEIQAATRQQVEIRQEQAQQFRDLARLMLDDQQMVPFSEAMEQARRKADELLARRHDKLAVLERQLDDVVDRQNLLEKERQAAHNLVWRILDMHRILRSLQEKLPIVDISRSDERLLK